jgi:hypothetical protein
VPKQSSKASSERLPNEFSKASGGDRAWQRSGGEFGRAPLPVPGQKLIKVLDGVIGDASEHVGFLR